MDAVALFTGPLESAIKRFKYQGRAGWGVIFGRLIVGWLDAHEAEAADIDLIIGNPTAPGRTPIQHIEDIMEAARAEDTRKRWPFASPEQPVLAKVHATPKSAGGRVVWGDKMKAAREHAEALTLLGSVKDKRILLVDDVFTTGAQFHAVGKYLMESGGAREIRGLTLARTPFGS